MPNRYYIPNILESWKWPCRVNPHYLEVKAASAAWLRVSRPSVPKLNMPLIVATPVQAEASCTTQLLH